LDDSSDQGYRKQVDDFAALYPKRVRVVRRSDRQGFKAGNLNHALADAASQEEVFALADADEILPSDFLKKMVPHLLNDPSCGFVQANHRCNRQGASLLAKEMGDGIDIHWRWYQPLRNRYGFVMLLGHGAVLRRKCWEEVGGFPHLVSEDLAYAVRLREKGCKGTFAEDVICLEDFPDSVQSFRIRFMKWTRGTCELLTHEALRILRAKKISIAEKADILFPTLNLPLSMFYFLFIVDANVVIPMLFGTPRPLTLSFAGNEFILPLRGLGPGFEVVFSLDFFIITILTMLAPVLCFIIEFWKRPIHLFKFLCRSTAVYSALGPIASLGVFSYLMTKKATFFVTGDQTSYSVQNKIEKGVDFFQKLRKNTKKLFFQSHPSHGAVQMFELLCGLAFGSVAILLANLSLLGLAIAFSLHPLMHRISWEHPLSQGLVFLPFMFILAGVTTSLLGLLGLQPLFFGFGFHF
ncbi:MAG: glycosyltransferase family 2 protein, partial [Nitrospiria bacterium]